MKKDKITKQELVRISNLYIGGKKTEKEYSYALKNFFFYIKKKYQLFDDDARKMVSDMGDILSEQLEKSANCMGDGKAKRQISRELSKINGGHFDFSNVIKFLSNPASDTVTINLETEKLFTGVGQNIIDFLYDVSKNSLKREKFFIVTLYYSAVDELLVAFHLAQRGFTAQSFHHSRTVLEIINLIKLFENDNKWVYLWLGDDEEMKRKEFSPSSVRKKLGKPGFDPVYGMLSEMGTHATFNYTKPKSILRMDNLKDISATITLGGNKSSSDYVWTNTACLHSTMMLFSRLTSSFSCYLIEEEVIEIVDKLFNEYKKYLSGDFILWAKENGLDTVEMEEYLKNVNINF